mmetsp:Transcript_343/g.1135  ORF Transcript_343/g.1135 Transcript_343/m.1135 type:complete len:227 (-) Transcript_343:427-1107(-)
MSSKSWAAASKPPRRRRSRRPPRASAAPCGARRRGAGAKRSPSPPSSKRTRATASSGDFSSSPATSGLGVSGASSSGHRKAGPPASLFRRGSATAARAVAFPHAWYAFQATYTSAPTTTIPKAAPTSSPADSSPGVRSATKPEASGRNVKTSSMSVSWMSSWSPKRSAMRARTTAVPLVRGIAAPWISATRTSVRHSRALRGAPVASAATWSARRVPLSSGCQRRR